MVVVSPDAGVEEVEESEESEEDTDATDGEDDGFVVVRSEKSASSVGDPECATTDTPSKRMFMIFPPLPRDCEARCALLM